MLITPSGVQLTGNHPGLIIARAGKADSTLREREQEASCQREEAQSTKRRAVVRRLAKMGGGSFYMRLCRA